VTEKSTLPSREEHNALIRRIWKIGFYVAGGCFAFMAAVVAVMLALGKSTAEIVSVELLVVYIFLPAYAFGFVAPMLASSLMKMTLAVDMSREGLEIGKDTSDAMTEFKNETKPLVGDLKSVIAEVKPMVGKIGTTVDDVKKIFDETVKELKEGNGKLENKVVKTLRKAIDEARNTVKDAEGEFERLIWNKVDKFLATVFEERQDEPVSNGDPEGAPVGDRDQAV
jgi:polyhydroxyalkanoate synthesis regulator phasin